MAAKTSLRLIKRMMITTLSRIEKSTPIELVTAIKYDQSGWSKLCMQKIRHVKNLGGTSQKSSLIPSESSFVDAQCVSELFSQPLLNTINLSFSVVMVKTKYTSIPMIGPSLPLVTRPMQKL